MHGVYFYYKKLVRRALRDFGEEWRTELLITGAVAALSLGFGVYYGLISWSALSPNAKVVFYPILTIAGLLLFWRFIQAPWRLDEENNAQHASDEQQVRNLRSDIAEIKTSL